MSSRATRMPWSGAVTLFCAIAAYTSALPASAQTDALHVAPSGNVGIGTSAPAEKLHLQSAAAANTWVSVENTNAAPKLVGLLLDNTHAGNRFFFSINTVGDFSISEASTGGAEFTVYDGMLTGNSTKFQFRQGNEPVLLRIEVDGDVFAGKDIHAGNDVYANQVHEASDRNVKTDIVPVDPREVLMRVSELPISTWRYKSNTDELHMGPMGQDFWGVFGLSKGPRTISIGDLSGVALAALQGLHQTVLEKDQIIDELLARVSALEALTNP